MTNGELGHEVIAQQSYPQVALLKQVKGWAR